MECGWLYPVDLTLNSFHRKKRRAALARTVIPLVTGEFGLNRGLCQGVTKNWQIPTSLRRCGPPTHCQPCPYWLIEYLHCDGGKRDRAYHFYADQDPHLIASDC